MPNMMIASFLVSLFLVVPLTILTTHADMRPSFATHSTIGFARPAIAFAPPLGTVMMAPYGYIKSEPERLRLDVGGINGQARMNVWGWKIEMVEEDNVVFDLLSTNNAPFNDPNHPNETVKTVRFVRCKPLQGFWSMEEHLVASRGSNVSLFPRPMRPDHEDNFYFAQQQFGPNDWRNYNADNISGLSTAQVIENGNAVRVAFGGTQPISFILRGRKI